MEERTSVIAGYGCDLGRECWPQCGRRAVSGLLCNLIDGQIRGVVQLLGTAESFVLQPPDGRDPQRGIESPHQRSSAHVGLRGNFIQPDVVMQIFLHPLEYPGHAVVRLNRYRYRNVLCLFPCAVRLPDEATGESTTGEY